MYYSSVSVVSMGKSHYFFLSIGIQQFCKYDKVNSDKGILKL